MENKYFVLYFAKDDNTLQHIELYTKTKWNGYENCLTDINSYTYGYKAKILDLEEGVDNINYYLNEILIKNIKLEQENFRQNQEIAKLYDCI